MKITTEGFKLTIDLVDLVDSLSKDDRVKLARLVAADEQLFAGVLDCVAEGHFFSDDESGAWWFDSRKVLELREKLLPLMPQIAQDAVKEALRQRNRAQQEAKEKDLGYWSLYHTWPSDRWHLKPLLSRNFVMPPDPTLAEITSLFGSSTPPDDPDASPAAPTSSPQSPSEEPT